MNTSVECSISRRVRPLYCFNRNDLEQVGGKAAHLGELIQAKFPIPSGFVVTTVAYDLYVEQNQLYETIAEELDENKDDGYKIRSAFDSAAIPLEIQREILEAYGQLGWAPVAVRSSATAEDLPEAAFVGQQDTFLNIIGGEDLLNAVRRCWASLWSDRAIAYRKRQGFDQQAVKLAVLVQFMISAEAAGVLFTANPVTGERNEVVVDASAGLGEAVVSGLVTPDHFVLRKHRWGWKITERRLGRSEVFVRALPGGGAEDIFHLKLDELEGVNGAWPPPPELAKHLRTTMVLRKERRAVLEGTHLVDPRLYRQAQVGDEALLIGTPGSPGIADGPVRVIHSAAEFGNLRSGEVLVAPYTNPAWTPLFQRAAAVVVDGGSPGSHAASVARGYGLPAVMGTVIGTQKLKDGEWVKVDGSRRVVIPAKPH